MVDDLFTGEDAADATKTYTNEFGWSVSRDRTFYDCKRRYFYSYYGHWGGWEEDADPAVREIWFLKQLQSRHMWVGGLVHETAKTALTFARQNHQLPPVKELLERTDREMREQFRASRENVLRDGGGEQTTRLFEHEYDSRVKDDEWKTMHRRAIGAVRSLVASDVLARALAGKMEDWLPVEDYASFEVDGLPVRAKLDFAFRSGDEIHIVDWKTGARASAPNRLQLACYALYASKTWETPIERVHAFEVNLVRNQTQECRVDAGDVADLTERIRSSTDEMRRRLVDVETNEAEIDSFEPVKEWRVCRWCNFQRVCLGGTADAVLKRKR